MTSRLSRFGRLLVLTVFTAPLFLIVWGATAIALWGGLRHFSHIRILLP